MRYYKNVIIIGTSHISPESVAAVEKEIAEKRPEVVAVELDRGRLNALMSGCKRGINLGDIRRVGFKGWVFAILGQWIEKKLGNKVGVYPGEEMARAVRAGAGVGAKIALIDQPIDVTLKRFSKRITWKEKFRFIWDLLTGWLRKDMRMKINLKKVPDEELIEKMLGIVKERYPNVYDVLITERNAIMAKHLNKLMQKHNSIIAVLGAGHEKEVIKEIKRLEAC